MRTTIFSDFITDVMMYLSSGGVLPKQFAAPNVANLFGKRNEPKDGYDFKNYKVIDYDHDEWIGKLHEYQGTIGMRFQFYLIAHALDSFGFDKSGNIIA